MCRDRSRIDSPDSPSRPDGSLDRYDGTAPGGRAVIGPLALAVAAIVAVAGFEELFPFLVPVFLFVSGLVGYGVLVLLYRWLDDA